MERRFQICRHFPVSFFFFPYKKQLQRILWLEHDWKSQAQPNHGCLLNFILKTSIKRWWHYLCVTVLGQTRWVTAPSVFPSADLEAPSIHPEDLAYIWALSAPRQVLDTIFFSPFSSFSGMLRSRKSPAGSSLPVGGHCPASARRLLLLQILLPLFARYPCSRESDKGADLCISAGLVLT